MNLLIIDDNKSVRLSLKMVLSGEFDTITTIEDPRLIPALVKSGRYDAVLLDMNFDNMKLDGSDGLFWLNRIREHNPAPAVVLITAFGNVGLAVEAMKFGAADFITKPWDNDELKSKLRAAVANNRRAIEQDSLINAARELENRRRDRESMTLDEIKTAHVMETLDRCGGNLSAAASLLGVTRQTLYNIIRKEK